MKGLYKKIGATIVGAIAVVNVMALDELNVAYFEEWPMPFEYAKQIGAYDEALGMTVNWSSFGTGTAMSAAMASGDIDISVSQGVPHLLWQPLQDKICKLLTWQLVTLTMTTVL